MAGIFFFLKCVFKFFSFFLSQKNAQLVIVTLQHTPYDRDCFEKVYCKTDEFMQLLMKELQMDKFDTSFELLDTLPKDQIFGSGDDDDDDDEFHFPDPPEKNTNNNNKNTNNNNKNTNKNSNKDRCNVQ